MPRGTAGASTVQPTRHAPSPITAPVLTSAPETTNQTNHWAAIHFHIAWKANTSPAWHVGVLLADRVLRDTVIAYGADLILWRVHRRAAPDEAGHRFSFTFFASPSVIKAITAHITTHPDVKALLAGGLVDRVVISDDHQSDIGATSDPTWAPELQ
jgi:hypothetical protein